MYTINIDYIDLTKTLDFLVKMYYIYIEEV